MSEHSPENDLEVPVDQSAPPSPLQVNVRLVAMFGVGLVVLIVVSMWLMFSMLNWLGYASPRIQPVTVERDEQVTRPRVQLNPNQPVALKDYMKEQHELLNSYGWVNEQQDLGRIPIDRAMQLVVERYKAEE